jgi:hypothetical protein
MKLKFLLKNACRVSPLTAYGQVSCTVNVYSRHGGIPHSYAYLVAAVVAKSWK